MNRVKQKVRSPQVQPTYQVFAFCMQAPRSLRSNSQQSKLVFALVKQNEPRSALKPLRSPLVCVQGAGNENRQRRRRRQKSPAMPSLPRLYKKQGNEPSDYKVEKPPALICALCFQRAFPKPTRSQKKSQT